MSKRISYLGDLISTENLFKPGPSSNTTMLEVLDSVQVCLVGFKRYLLYYLQGRSAREELNRLVSLSRLLIRKSVECVHFSLRDQSKLSQRASISYLRTFLPTCKKGVGDGLLVLLQTPTFKTLFQEDLDSEALEQGLLTLVQPNFKKDLEKLEKNTFEVPSILLSIVSAQKFLELHGYIESLANFTLMCERLHRLSGDGGNLMIYGLLNVSVSDLMSSYQKCLAEACHKFSQFINKLDASARKRLAGGMQSKNPWFDNYQFSKAAHEEFVLHSMEAVREIDQIKSRAEVGITEAELMRIKRDIADVIRSGDHLCRQWLGHGIRDQLNVLQDKEVEGSLKPLEHEYLKNGPSKLVIKRLTISPGDDDMRKVKSGKSFSVTDMDRDMAQGDVEMGSIGGAEESGSVVSSDEEKKALELCREEYENNSWYDLKVKIGGVLQEDKIEHNTLCFYYCEALNTYFTEKTPQYRLYPWSRLYISRMNILREGMACLLHAASTHNDEQLRAHILETHENIDDNMVYSKGYTVFTRLKISRLQKLYQMMHRICETEANIVLFRATHHHDDDSYERVVAESDKRLRRIEDLENTVAQHSALFKKMMKQMNLSQGKVSNSEDELSIGHENDGASNSNTNHAG